MNHSENGNTISPDVYCDVKNCTYNNGDYKCTANRINVGPTYAVSTNDTACATFKPQAR